MGRVSHLSHVYHVTYHTVPCNIMLCIVTRRAIGDVLTPSLALL